MEERERAAFEDAQRGMLERHGVDARAWFVPVPSTGGRAQVLVSGDGPAVVMLNGIGTPAAMWAPLMACLPGFRLHAVDLPGFGLTDPAPRLAADPRGGAALFLREVLDALGLDRPAFVASSLGSLWTCWLALERPERVAAVVHAGCPALALGTSAPLPMRILSVRSLGRLLTRLRPPSPAGVEALGRRVREHPLSPELARLLLATQRLPRFRDAFLGTLHALLRLRGGRPGARLGPEQLAGITAPTILFWGERDPFGAPAVGERVAAALPRAALHVVPGGHAPWLTQAERMGPVAAAFLREHP